MNIKKGDALSERLACYASDQYEKTLPLLGERAREISEMVEGLKGGEKVLMEFLYGTMPLCDAADYEPGLFYAYVRHGLWLRKEYAWTGELSEELFLNYVLCHRVNNEALADCRGWFYEALEPMVKGCSPEEAVKKVNYWCACQASYAASDQRTLSPKAVCASGSGRCGEESVFLVTALRSVGIAARQVYAPRWAHCDDNHAWVEAWVEGRWHFLGACEPEEVLDKGWFTNASSRAMLVHARVFSGYFGIDQEKPEITERDGAAFLLNVTDSYARVRKLTVLVKNEEGKPVKGARVSFALLNMAEYKEIARLFTDEEGRVSLTLGLGSIRIQAAKGNTGCELMVENGRTERVEAVLSQEFWHQDLENQEEQWHCLDWKSPRDFPMHPVKLSKEQKERGKHRKQKSDSQRRGKLARYCMQADQFAQELVNGPLSALAEKEAEFLREVLRLSRGNFYVIYRFCRKHPEKDALDFLALLAQKDYCDIQEEILEEHFTWGRQIREFSYREYLAQAREPEELFLRYVWNPRIGYEELTPYRSFLAGRLSEEQKKVFVREPGRIWEWIQREIGGEETEGASRGYSSRVTSPVGVMAIRRGSLLAKKTLFVAICRTLGIPARLHPATGKAQYYAGSKFRYVEGEDRREVFLRLTSQDKPEYYASWTIGRLARGPETGEGENYFPEYETLDFTGAEFQEGALVLHLPEGIYRLVTTVRLPDGNQLTASRDVYPGDFLPGKDSIPELTMPLYFRRPSLSQMLEELALESFTLENEDGIPISDEEALEGRYTLLAFLEEGTEPTEHLLNELLERRQEVAERGLTMVWVVRGKEALKHPTLAKASELLGAQIYYDDFETLPEQLARRMYTDPDKLPLVLLVSPKRMGRYASSGYNVGSVGLLLAIAGMIEKRDNT